MQPSTNPASSPAPPLIAEPTGSTRTDAADFTRYWFDQLNAAYREVDPSRLVPISSPGCVTCQAYIGSLAAAKAAGKTYTGGQITVLEAVAEPEPTDTTTVLVNIDSPPGQELDREGKVLGTVPGDNNTTIVFDVRWQQGRWLAAEVAQA